MAQKQFTTFRQAIESFPLGERNVGILKPGRYNGFDSVSSLGGLDIEIGHLGLVPKTDKTGTPDNNFGAIMMPTGIVIHETGRPRLTINTNSGNNNLRVDLVICEHEYQPVQGGTPAIYSIIQGPIDGGTPTLPNPEKQIIIGRIKVQPNGYQFSDISYEVEMTPLPGDLTYIKLSQLITQSFTVPDATINEKGKAALATQDEVLSGSVSNKIVTPLTLKGLTANEDRRGLSEVATNQEVLAGLDDERYITPKKLKANLMALSLKKEYIESDRTLTAEDNGKVLVSSGSGGQINIIVPPNLPNDYHVGMVWNTRSIRVQGGPGVNIHKPTNKLPEISTQFCGILLESSGDSVNYFLLGNLK